MRSIAFAAIVLMGQFAYAQVLVVSDSEPAPTLAPADCKCELCDCVDCDGNCQEAKPIIKLASVVRQAKLERLDNEIALLDSLRPGANQALSATNVGARKGAHDVVATQTGEWRWVQTGTQFQCNGRSCGPVAVYGWKFYKAAAKAAPKPAVVPVKAKSNQGASKARTPISFANRTDGYAIDETPPAPTNSTGSAASSQYYSVEGPYAGSYAAGGCGGSSMGGGCGGNGGCGGGGGCGGARGILGRLFGGRRRG